MSSADLTAALKTVEQDHQLVLEKMKALQEILGYLLDQRPMDPPEVIGRLREINNFFGEHLSSHLAEEENSLFPFLEKNLPDGPDLVGHLLLDHAELRHKRGKFNDCLEIAGQLQENLPQPVLRDLYCYGWELWALLDKHAHQETEAVHRCVSQSLAGKGSAEKEKR